MVNEDALKDSLSLCSVVPVRGPVVVLFFIPCLVPFVEGFGVVGFGSGEEFLCPVVGGLHSEGSGPLPF